MLVSDPDLTSLLPPPEEGSGTSCRDLCPLLPWSDRAALFTLTLPLKLVLGTQVLSGSHAVLHLTYEKVRT